MFRSVDNSLLRSGVSWSATLLAGTLLHFGCIGLDSSQRAELEDLETRHISCDEPPVGFEPPNSQTVAGLLNVLPGLGSYYIASGTGGRPWHYLWGTANLLLWPISIVWAAPEGYIDAGRINQLELLEYCHNSDTAETGSPQLRYRVWLPKRAPLEMVVSKCNAQDVAAIINGVAVIPGEVYGYLAEGADKAMARNAGREIYEAIMRDKNAGTTMEEIRRAVSDADWAAAAEYAKFVKAQDYTALKAKLSRVSTKLADDGSKVADALLQIRKLDSLSAMNMMAKAVLLKTATSEINAITDQLASSVKAVQIWQDLNEQDEIAKKFMQDYPVEN